MIGLIRNKRGKEALNKWHHKAGEHTPLLHWASSDPPKRDWSETMNTLFDLGADIDPKIDCEGGIPPPRVVDCAASGNAETSQGKFL